jgi:hypothetical protein
MKEGEGRANRGETTGTYEQKVVEASRIEKGAGSRGWRPPYHRVPGAPPPSSLSLSRLFTSLPLSNGADSRWGASSQRCRRANPSRCSRAQPPFSSRARGSKNEETIPYRRTDARRDRSECWIAVWRETTERRRWWRTEMFFDPKNSLAVRSISFGSWLRFGGDYGGWCGGVARLPPVYPLSPHTASVYAGPRFDATWARGYPSKNDVS